MDVSGEVHLDVEHDVYKQRLDPTGRPLTQHDPVRHEVGPAAVITNKPGEPADPAAAAAKAGADAEAAAAAAAAACQSCYGAEDETSPCCNTCSEVRAAYQRKGWALDNLEAVEQCRGEGYNEAIQAQRGEGCRLWGDLLINKVAGNVHFAPGRSFQQGAMHVHDLAPFAGMPMDMSHAVAKLAFGREYPVSRAAGRRCGAVLGRRGWLLLWGGGGGGQRVQLCLR
jgi:hypothetical protein